MRPDHWWAHPFNRRRARRAGGVGSVIAATSAGLIAGLTQHPHWTQTTHSITDAAVNKAGTHLDTTPPAASAPIALIAPDPRLAAAAASAPRHDLTDAQTPSTTTTVSPPSTAGTAPFRPYTRNGIPPVVSDFPPGPAGNAVTPGTTTGSTNGQPDPGSQLHTPTPTDTVALLDESPKHKHGDDHADTSAGDQDGHHNNSNPADTSNRGSASSALAPDIAATGGGAQDSQTQSRIASALPPGFTPSQPRQSATSAPTSGASVSTWPAPATPPALPASSPAAVQAPALPQADSATPPVTDNGLATSPPPVPRPTGPLISQYPPPIQPATSPMPGVQTMPGRSLTRVQCPAAVADATCYQQQPSPEHTSPAAASTTPPLTTSSSAPGAATALPVPTVGGTQIPTSSGSSGSGWSCQGSSGDTSNVRLRNWSDLGQLISDRLQQCMAEAINDPPTSWDTGSTNKGTASGSSSANPTDTKDSKHSKAAKSSKKSEDD